MNKHYQQGIRRLLSTDNPRWRQITPTLLLTIFCVAVVGDFIYLYASIEKLHCYTGFLYASLLWLVVELLTIAYLYKYDNIPRFARNLITMLIGFSNIWFILFLFSIPACAN